LYVVRLEPAARRVVVGPKSALARRELSLRQVNWLDGAAPPAEGLEVEVKLRSTSTPIPATFHGDAAGGARVVLHRPELGVAAGQACVAYQGSRVLGGGWILRESTAGQPAAA
jgi:tRNA-specific 2-thiouridylase